MRFNRGMTPEFENKLMRIGVGEFFTLHSGENYITAYNDKKKRVSMIASFSNPGKIMKTVYQKKKSIETVGMYLYTKPCKCLFLISLTTIFIQLAV